MAVAAACHILAGDTPAVVDDVLPTGPRVPGWSWIRGGGGQSAEELHHYLPRLCLQSQKAEE